jgi:hypothetical protein
MGEVSDVIKSTGDFSATKNAATAMGAVKNSMEKTAETMLKFNQVGEVQVSFMGRFKTLPRTFLR